MKVLVLCYNGVHVVLFLNVLLLLNTQKKINEILDFE
jgi:hypothetical protein